VVTCLLLDPRFVASNLAEDSRFLRVIKTCCTTFFRDEVKLSIPCKILQQSQL
jgi:hypothetical protein